MNIESKVFHFIKNHTYFLISLYRKKYSSMFVKFQNHTVFLLIWEIVKSNIF